MSDTPRFLLIETDVLPEVFLKVVEAKKLLISGRARSVGEAARLAGISRGAFYKYRDKVRSYSSEAANVVTLQTILRDEAGVLSALTGALYECGANVLTINQNIPVGRHASVTVTVRMQGVVMTLDEMLDRLRGVGGVESVELVSGEHLY
jgi:chorismate mutase